MQSDTVLRSKGMRVLSEHMGMVEAERFITLILREPFDYTEWRQELFKDEDLDGFLQNAADYRRQTSAHR